MPHLFVEDFCFSFRLLAYLLGCDRLQISAFFDNIVE